MSGHVANYHTRGKASEGDDDKPTRKGGGEGGQRETMANYHRHMGNGSEGDESAHLKGSFNGEASTRPLRFLRLGDHLLSASQSISPLVSKEYDITSCLLSLKQKDARIDAECRLRADGSEIVHSFPILATSVALFLVLYSMLNAFERLFSFFHLPGPHVALIVFFFGLLSFFYICTC